MGIETDKMLHAGSPREMTDRPKINRFATESKKVARLARVNGRHLPSKAYGCTVLDMP